MTTRDEARRELELLFPPSEATGGPDLDATDPEFITFYRDFAFGEVLRHSSLDRRDRLIYQLAALIAMGALYEFRAMLGAALTAGVSPIQAKELTYQAVPYVGVARAIEFVFAANEVLAERGVELPLAGQSTTTPESRMEVGRATQSSIVGADRVDAMYSGAPADALRFQEFLSGNCFGDYYTRGGLEVKQRELITFALLTGLGGADNQVKGHVAANLHVGNTRGELLDVLTVLLPYVGYPRTLNALAQVNAVAPAETASAE